VGRRHGEHDSGHAGSRKSRRSTEGVSPMIAFNKLKNLFYVYVESGGIKFTIGAGVKTRKQAADILDATNIAFGRA
jgi:hypothetical protein